MTSMSTKPYAVNLGLPPSIGLSMVTVMHTLRRTRGRLSGLRRQARLILAGIQESILRRGHAANLRGNSDPGLMD